MLLALTLYPIHICMVLNVASKLDKPTLCRYVFACGVYFSRVVMGFLLFKGCVWILLFKRSVGILFSKGSIRLLLFKGSVFEG